MKRVLVVDDDLYIGNMIEEALQEEGYLVLRAYSGTETMLVLEKLRPDLVLLDLMLPGISGEDVLSRIKGIPVIVVSAKADIDNKVDLLMGGAADYITKPFNMKELTARIAVQFRNDAVRSDESLLTFEDIKLDTDTHTVNIENCDIKLTRTEFAVLKLLMQNPTRVTTKSALLDRISVDTPDCTESSLKIHVSNLRKKLRAASGREYIEAVWGIGFKLKRE